MVGPSRERPPRWGDVAIHRAECERILRIVSKMIVQFGGDPTRVFMGGHSWGGALCYAAAADFPHHFAGIVHIYGNLYSRGDAFRESDGAVTLPILVLRAEHDQYNKRFYDPQRKIAFAELEKAGYTNVTLQHVRGADHGDALRALRESAPWLRAIRGGDLFGERR